MPRPALTHPAAQPGIESADARDVAPETLDHRPCHRSSFTVMVGFVGIIGERFGRYTRWMYRSGRPNWIARPQNRLSSILFGAGIFPRRVATLEVPGRRSGRIISMPVVIADWEGDEHLVSMLGERANWRQIVIVPTVAWLLILRAGQRIPLWLIYPTAAVWASVAVLRTAAV